MKKAWIVASALVFVSVAGFAQVPSQAPLTSEALAAILGSPAATGACATQQSGMLFAAKGAGNGPVKAACTATAACETGTVSCSGTSSCTALDRNCASGVRGQVTCNGVTTLCPTVCGCNFCCQCAQTGDCFACCRCEGYPYIVCSRSC